VTRQLHIRLLPAEKGLGTTQKHCAKTKIWKVKLKWKSRMQDNNVPAQLWDFGLVDHAEIQSLLARGTDQCPGMERVWTDCLHLQMARLRYYDRVWYWSIPKDDMNDDQTHIGRWLGISHRVSTDMK
jgi:hypothetical protein